MRLKLQALRETKTNEGLIGQASIQRMLAFLRPRKGLLDLAVVLGAAVVGLLLIHKVFQPGFPPGVDTPLFLHLSWFAQKTLRGSNGGWLDSYWYGGFHPFTTYPPLTYTVIAALATLPGVGLVLAYKGVLLVAYVGTGLATYVLARELGSGRPWSVFAGFLVILAHPLLVALGLWGWLASVVAMPFALLALAGLEHAFHHGRLRFAVWGGIALGAAVLSHHMTAFAFGLGLPTWFLFSFLRYASTRRHLSRVALWFAGATTLVTLWWIIPWLINVLEAGFRREVPGLWTFPLVDYLEAITSADIIAQYAFPSYLGLAFIVVAIGGTIQALVAPSRHTPYAMLLLILVAFSLGEQVNPLLRVRPFDGLDVARFHLYMVPAMALVGLPFLASVGGGIGDLLRLRRAPSWLPAVVSSILAFIVLGQMARDAAVASQRLFQPYQVGSSLQEALDWFAEAGHEGKVLGVGFWHWDDFLLPYDQRRPVVDGWHDEGARNWRTVRPLRLMMWTREIDVPKAYRLLGELDGRYIAIDSCYPGEAPSQFRQALRSEPGLFREVAEFRASFRECEDLFPQVSRSFERFMASLDPSYSVEDERVTTIFQRVPARIVRSGGTPTLFEKSVP